MASATFARMLNRRATVRRPSLADAGHGASTQTLSVVGVDVPCALSPISERERATAAQLEVAYDHRLFLLPGVDIKRGDAVEVLPPLLVEGREPVYRVVDVRDPGHRGDHLEAHVAQELSPLVSAAAAVLPPENLLNNTSATLDTAGWAGAGAVVTRDTITTRDGASFRVAATGTSGMYAASGNRPLVVAGEPYTLQFWAYFETAGRSMSPRIQWRPSADGGGTSLATHTFTVAAPSGSWLYVVVTGIAPAGAVSALVELYASAAATYYLDQIQFRQAAGDAPYEET